MNSQRLIDIRGLCVDFKIEYGNTIVNEFKIKSSLGGNKHFIILKLNSNVDYADISELVGGLVKKYRIHDIYVFDNITEKYLVAFTFCKWCLYKKILFSSKFVDYDFVKNTVVNKCGELFVNTDLKNSNDCLYFIGKLIFKSNIFKQDDEKMFFMSDTINTFFSLITNTEYDSSLINYGM